MRPIETDDLTILFDARICVHARRCVLGLPKVFDPDGRPWIQPEHASTSDIVAVIEACPSGALQYARKTGANELPPKANTVRVWENGPLEVRGDIRIEGHDPRHRALLCRCGKTDSPPFCNNAHRAGFCATGLPAFNEGKDKDLDAADGPLEVTPTEDGPCVVKGNVEVIGSDGRRVARTRKAWLCRCGASESKPFCDGSHNKIGFRKAVSALDG